MNIVFHIGAHNTDADLLLRTVLRNRDRLWARGCAVPAPGSYRSILHTAIADLAGTRPSEEMRDLLLDSIVTEEGVTRLILSHEDFLAGKYGLVRQGELYPNAGKTFEKLSSLLPGDDYEFFLAIKNPVAVLADQMAATPKVSYDEIMAGADPRSLRWAPVIRRMLSGLGADRLVIWCREDTPYIWPELLSTIIAAPPGEPVLGGVSLITKLLSEEGNAWLKQEWQARPPGSIEERRASVEQALSRFARPDETEATVAIPGWSQRLIDDITEIYQQDIAEIAALPGVEFLSA